MILSVSCDSRDLSITRDFLKVELGLTTKVVNLTRFPLSLLLLSSRDLASSATRRAGASFVIRDSVTSDSHVSFFSFTHDSVTSKIKPNK